MNSQLSSQSGRARLGCLGPGCLIASIITIITALVLGYVIARSMRGAVDYYTTEAVQPLETAQPSPASASSLDAKLDTLRDALQQNRAVAVTLTKDEVAALPWSSKVPSGLRERLVLSVEGDQLVARFSTRLRDIGSFGVASAIVSSRLDRAVSGIAKSRLTSSGGVITLTLTELTLSGHRFEDVALNGATVWFNGAMHSYFSEHPQLAARLEKVEIASDSVTVALRPAPSTPLSAP